MPQSRLDSSILLSMEHNIPVNIEETMDSLGRLSKVMGSAFIQLKSSSIYYYYYYLRTIYIE